MLPEQNALIDEFLTHDLKNKTKNSKNRTRHLNNFNAGDFPKNPFQIVDRDCLSKLKSEAGLIEEFCLFAIMEMITVQNIVDLHLVTRQNPNLWGLEKNVIHHPSPPPEKKDYKTRPTIIFLHKLL